MEEEKKDRGFKVVDRRLKVDEEIPPEPKIEKPSEQAPKPPLQIVTGTSAGPEPKSEPGANEPGPSEIIDFSNFFMSLATSAVIQLGLAPDPTDGQYYIDIEAAQQTIDIIAMLKDKTRGNLTPQEESLISKVLADLRLRFVEKKSGR